MKIEFITLLIAFSLNQLCTAVTCNCKCSDGASFTLNDVAGASACALKLVQYCPLSTISSISSCYDDDASGIPTAVWIIFGVMAFIGVAFLIFVVTRKRWPHIVTLRTIGHHKNVGVYHSGAVVTTGHEMTDVSIHGVSAHGISTHGVTSHGVSAHGIPAHGVSAHGIPAHGVSAHAGNFAHGIKSGHGGSFAHGGKFGHVGGHH